MAKADSNAGEFEFLSYSVEDGVGVALMNRPPANALTEAMAQELHDVCTDVVVNEEVRCLVIGSSLERFYMAGGDIGYYATITPMRLAEMTRRYRELFHRIHDLPIPTIAAIHGHAVGAGAELAVACDLRIVSRDVHFSFAEVKLGGFPAAGGTQYLPRLVGYERAMEILLTGRDFGADEALAMGMVGTVADDAVATARAMAGEIAGMPPVAVRAIKNTVRTGFDFGLDAGLAAEQGGAEAIARTDEFQQRVRDFVTRHQGGQDAV